MPRGDCDVLSPAEPLWLACSLAEEQDAGFCGVAAGFFGVEDGFFGVGAKQDPDSTTSSLLIPGLERGRAEPVSPISHRAMATLVLHGSCLQNCSHHLPRPLSLQGRARRTARPAPPRHPHSSGTASPPAARVFTLPTATGCPTKSARGTVPPHSQPEQSRDRWGVLAAITKTMIMLKIAPS